MKHLACRGDQDHVLRLNLDCGQPRPKRHERSELPQRRAAKGRVLYNFRLAQLAGPSAKILHPIAVDLFGLAPAELTPSPFKIPIMVVTAREQQHLEQGEHASPSYTPARPVLVVDDYADSRATLREMLEHLGQEVVEARDGQEAFNFLIFHPEVRVQLILLDLEMPGMNGWDLLTLLKTYVRLASIPVVIVSRRASLLKPSELRTINGAFKAPYELLKLRAMVEAIVSH
jgi:CheY-like chemotaxis protein